MFRERRGLESSKEIVFMALHIGSGGGLHLESSGSSICFIVRGLERSPAPLRERACLGKAKKLQPQVAVLCVVKDAAGRVLRVPGATVFGILEGNCVYGATHWVWG